MSKKVFWGSVGLAAAFSLLTCFMNAAGARAPKAGVAQVHALAPALAPDFKRPRVFAKVVSANADSATPLGSLVFYVEYVFARNDLINANSSNTWITVDMSQTQ